MALPTLCQSLAAVFQLVYPVLAVYSHGLQASKRDHPDYGDADLNASQKVHKANWSCRRKRTVLVCLTSVCLTRMIRSAFALRCSGQKLTVFPVELKI